MSDFIPIKRMRERLSTAKSESDAEYFSELMLFAEMVAKIVTATLVASIQNDPARHRYAQLHRLVRADGLGDWDRAGTEIVTGAPSQFIRPAAQELARALSQRVDEETWQHRSTSLLLECKAILGLDAERPAKIAGRQWIAEVATLRNKTRGHGAPLAAVRGRLAPLLEESIEIFVAGCPAFKLPWVYLRRNLSGKFRVSPISGVIANSFEALKGTTTVSLTDGIYTYFDEPVYVELMFSDPDLQDFFIPNGSYRDKTFEVLSYLTGATQNRDGAAYLLPTSELPPSATEGRGDLEVIGESLTNIPPRPADYVGRSKPESELRAALLDDRHPMITLVGPGGTGKTSLALEVLHLMATEDAFDLILWFSARDVDLLPSGPKPVRAHITTTKQIAVEYADLVGLGSGGKDFSAADAMARDLTKSALGRTLFVFDNFETVASPAEIYTWLDTYVRVPNKVLITTRTRDFKGDYPIDVKGMTREESNLLIDQTAAGLSMTEMLTSEYRDQLFDESEGHPYVIKILLGETKKLGRPAKPERIVADKGEILNALFERTYAALTPAARRVFLTLCGWKSIIAEKALKAVLLRPSNERFDVEDALSELERSSLVQASVSVADGEVFRQVPLAAAVFGKGKLKVDAALAAVEADIEMLQMFGAAMTSDVHRGIEPRVRSLFREVSRKLDEGAALADYQPVIEFVSGAYPRAWLSYADLLGEYGGTTAQIRRALTAFLQKSEGPMEVSQRARAWDELARLAGREGDVMGELHALVRFALSERTPSAMSDAANRINTILKAARTQNSISSWDERRNLLQPLVSLIESAATNLDGTGLSRFAWLRLNLRDEAGARQTTVMGLQRDPNNEHLLRLAHKLGIGSER